MNYQYPPTRVAISLFAVLLLIGMVPEFGLSAEAHDTKESSATGELQVTYHPRFGMPAQYRLKNSATSWQGVADRKVSRPWRYDQGPEFGSGCFQGDIEYVTQEGSYVEYTFAGSGIEYLALKTYRVGDEEIYIDGVKMATVNGFRNYDDGVLYKQVLYEARDLADTTHTIRIVKANAAQFMFLDGFMVYDAQGRETFINNDHRSIRYSQVVKDNTLEAVVRDPMKQRDIQAQMVLSSIKTNGNVTDAAYTIRVPDLAKVAWNGIVNDDDGAMKYTGPWIASAHRDDGSHSQDSHFSQERGSTLEYRFTGYGVECFGEQTPTGAMGKAYIREDSAEYVEIAPFNQIGPAKMVRKVFASFLSLDKQERTIKIEATDAGNVSFDFLRVYEDLTVMNDNDASISYGDGTWTASRGRNDGTYRSDSHSTQMVGASVTLPFRGVGIAVVPVGDSQGGDSDVFIDQTPVGTMSSLSSRLRVRQAAFIKTGLPDGPHTLRIVMKSGVRLAIDAFLVIPKGRDLPSDLPTIDAATATLRYTQRATGLTLTLDSVHEQNGYQLMDLHLKELVSTVSVRDDDWVAHGDGGGLLANLHSAPNCILNDRLRYLPLVMLGNHQGAVALEAQGYGDNTYLSIDGRGGEKKVNLGVIKRYRHKGNVGTANPQISQKEICTLDFVTDYDGNGIVDWLDPAKAVKARMPRKPTNYFDNVFTHISLMQLGRESEKPVKMTLAQYEDLVRRISLLIDGNSQMGALAGWAIGGHDTTYPNYTGINRNLGGLAGWRSSKQRVMDLYNVNITFDDNWDDQFLNPYTDKTSPTIGQYVDPDYAHRECAYFDLKNIKIGRDGIPQRCPAVWNGTDLGYLTSFSKYMRENGPGMERARYTIETYGLHDGILIDAISHPYHADLERCDFDPLAPASLYDELINKQKVFREFSKRGVHVASEYISYPFVGTMTYAVDGPTGGGWNEFGGTPIPLMALVYRDTIMYGAEGGVTLTYPDPKTWLFYNNRAGRWIAPSNTDQEIIGLYYMHYLPWMQLHDLDILTFNRTGERVQIGLEENSSIWIDYETGQFGASCRGRQIVDGYRVSLPMDDNRVAFYAESDTTLSYPLPPGITAEMLTAKRLSATEHRAHPVRVEKGNIVVDVVERVPVIVYLHKTTDGGVRIDHNAMNINYRGDWSVSDSACHSERQGDFAVFPFYGTGIAYFANKGPDMGEAHIYIDGRHTSTVNLNAPFATKDQELFRNTSLKPGYHSIKVVNSLASGKIGVASFAIYGAAP